MQTTRVCAGVAGFLAVALGAFGAHKLAPRLAEMGTTDVWRTAVLYHLVHAVALWAAATGAIPAGMAARGQRALAWCWMGGIVLFSGSLYGLALGGPRWLGPVTPVGGIAFLVGWAVVVAQGLRGSRDAAGPS